MTEELDLLRKLKGLGLINPMITYGDGAPGFVRIQVEAADPSRRDGQIMSVARELPYREIDHPTMPPSDARSAIYSEIYTYIRDAATSVRDQTAKGQVVIHGSCNHCGRTTVYAVPEKGPDEKKLAKPKKG